MLSRAKPVLVLLLVALTVIACSAWQWSSAKYEDVAITDRINPRTKKPIEVKNVFPPATPSIYCTTRMSMVPEDTQIKAEWIYEGGEDPALEGHVLDSIEDVIDEGGNLAFNLPAPDAGWMRGKYRVDLYVYDTKKASVSFVVQGPDAEPTIVESTACRALDPYQMSPVQPTDFFVAGVDSQLCASARLEFAPNPVDIVFAWYYVEDVEGAPVPQLITTIPVTTTGGRYLGCEIPVTEGKELTLGEYFVMVTVDGESQAEIPFRVVTPEEAKAIAAAAPEQGTMSDGSAAGAGYGDEDLEVDPAAVMMGLVLFAVYMLIILLFIVSQGFIFAKAGRPWWGCLVPIYNIYLTLKVAGKPGWWLLLALIPFVNFVFMFMLWFAHISIAKNFGKGVGFGLGLMFLPIIFYPVLAFGSAKYVAAGTPPPATVAPVPQG